MRGEESAPWQILIHPVTTSSPASQHQDHRLNHNLERVRTCPCDLMVEVNLGIFTTRAGSDMLRDSGSVKTTLRFLNEKGEMLR